MGAGEAHVGSPGGVEQNEEVEEEAQRSCHGRPVTDRSWAEGDGHGSGRVWAVAAEQGAERGGEQRGKRRQAG